MSFVGAFYYQDDFYNYLSYAQQAEEGAFLFQNRVLLREHAPALVNLEWWLVGRTSALLGGGRLLIAYRLFAVVAAAAFLLVADRWLRRLGLPEGHRLPALLLLATGGGLGGILFSFAQRPLTASLDLYAGLFPFLCLAVNPHFVAGTTLLLLSLHLFDTAATPRSRLVALAAANVLALVRPYDVVLLVLVRTASVLVLEPPRRWVATLVPLAGLFPVALYLYWLFYRNPHFAFYGSAPYAFPPLGDFAWALGPAALLALAGALKKEEDSEARRARVHLAAWAAFDALVLALRPVSFSLQFLVGIGAPCLMLGAGLFRRQPARRLALAALLFSTSEAALLRLVLQPNPAWLVPRENMELARALRGACRPGDILLAPPSLGLLAYGLSSCRAFLSHRVDPDHGRRIEELRAFAERGVPGRAELLDRYRITHLVLPEDAGPVPASWLGADTPFRRSATRAGAPRWTLYIREDARAGP
jgi:hypothetical protein